MARVPATLIRLGGSQLAILIAGVVTILTVVWFLLGPALEDFYVREFAFPRLEQKYGFRGGDVAVTRRSYSFKAWGIVSLKPDGELARMGLRSGDIPFGTHGGGVVAMYYALRSAERGRFSAFDVMNADNWNEEVRTIPSHPRHARMPTGFRLDSQELPAPTGRSVLVATQPTGPSGQSELWVRDVASGKALRLYTYEIHVEAVWSPDGEWIAVTDWDAREPRCMLLSTRGGERLNLSDLLGGQKVTSGQASTRETFSCRVFGWEAESSRVALTAWGYDANRRRTYEEDVFFDSSTRDFIRRQP